MYRPGGTEIAAANSLRSAEIDGVSDRDGAPGLVRRLLGRLRCPATTLPVSSAILQPAAVSG